MPTFFQADTKPLFIGVDEVALSTKESNYPILATFGAGQCIILAVYDANKEQAAIAHVASFRGNINPKYHALKSILDTMSQGAIAYIVGGMANNDISRTTVDELKKLLASHDIKIQEEAVFSYGGESERTGSLQIDSRTGNVSYEKMNQSGILERMLDSADVGLNTFSIVDTNTGKAKHFEDFRTYNPQPGYCTIL